MSGMFSAQDQALNVLKCLKERGGGGGESAGGAGAERLLTGSSPATAKLEEGRENAGSRFFRS